METMKETICRKFKEALESGGVKQIAVARRLGVAANTVQRWVNAEGTPSAENLRELSIMLGVPMEYFFDSSAPPSAVPQIDSKIDDLMAQLQAFKQPQQNIATLDPELQALFERSTKISSKYRKFLLEQIKMNLEIAEQKTARDAASEEEKKQA